MIERISDEAVERAQRRFMEVHYGPEPTDESAWRAALEASGAVFLTDSEKQALAWACLQPERAMHERCMFPHGSHARAFESAREKLG